MLGVITAIEFCNPLDRFAVAQDIESVLLSCRTLWPEEGTSTWRAEELSHWTDFRTDGTSSNGSSVAEWTLTVTGTDAHIVLLRKFEGLLKADAEFLDQGSTYLWQTRPGTDRAGLVQRKRRDGTESAYQTMGRSRLICGTVPSAINQRLADLIESNVDSLRNGWRCAESDGAVWDFRFEEMDGIQVPIEVGMTREYSAGQFKRYSERFTDTIVRRNSQDRLFVASFTSRWESEHCDGFRREAESTIRVLDYSWSATPIPLKFQYVPKEGTRVKVEGSDWLHHEWRDGKVVQVTDPEAMKRLEQFEYSNQGIGRRKLGVVRRVRGSDCHCGMVDPSEEQNGGGAHRDNDRSAFGSSRAGIR
jgi:hypothetical protein